MIRKTKQAATLFLLLFSYFLSNATATFTATSYTNDFVGALNSSGQTWTQAGFWGNNTLSYNQVNNELDMAINQNAWVFVQNAFTSTINITTNKVIQFSAKANTASSFLLVQLYDATNNTTGTQAQAIVPLNTSYTSYSIDFASMLTGSFNFSTVKGVQFWIVSNAQGSNYATFNGHLNLNNLIVGTGATNTSTTTVERWTGDAQNINIYNTNTGNVSLGTNPSLEPTLSTAYYKFTVAGRTNIVADQNAFSIWSTTTQSNGFRHYLTLGADKFTNGIEYGVIGTNEYKTSTGLAQPKHLLLQTNTTNGGANVGIGPFSIAPTAKLCVNSGTNVKAFSVVNSSGVDVFKVTNTGTVYATEIKVRLTPFPDYVFDSTYHLMSLDSVGTYINNNKHLPNMPSAEEVDSVQIGLGEMTRLQQEKIEELTLYLLQMDARMKELETQNKILAKKIEDAENKTVK